MEIDNVILTSTPAFHNPEGQYEIVDVDDGLGNVEQIIVTNDRYQGLGYHGLSSHQEAQADAAARQRYGPYGNYRPLFNGVVVVGPNVGKLFCSLICFLCLGVVLGLLFSVIAKELNVIVFYLGESLVVLCIVFLVWTSGTDPGIVPKDFNLNQYLFEIRNNNITPPTRPRWCRKCQATRPPRCYHCRDCDICIRRQDMHLLIGGVCVGSRNFRQYLAFNIVSSALAFYLLTLGIILIVKMLDKYPPSPSLDSETVFLRCDFNLSCVLMFCGATLVSFPQTGFIMFVYRLYLIAKNRTVREEYRAYVRGNDFNPFDNGITLNVWEFFGKSPHPSYIRKRINTFHCSNFSGKKKNQVGQISPPNCRWRIATFENPTDSDMVFFSRNPFGSQDRIVAEPHSYVETEHMRQNLNAQAKIKSHMSLPQLENGELPILPGTRFHLPLFPRPFEILQQKIKQFQLNQALPKSIISIRKSKHKEQIEGFGVLSQSESCLPLPETVDSTGIVHYARAFQIQQIINCVLRRDRRGLIELARKIDIAGLIGMDHFDPDNIQMIELNNGLPVLTARTHQRHHQQLRRLEQTQTQQQQSTQPQQDQNQNQLDRQNTIATSLNSNNVASSINQHQNQNSQLADQQMRQTASQNQTAQRVLPNFMGIPQMIAAGLMPNIRQQQQQAAMSSALARLHVYNLNLTSHNNNNTVNISSNLNSLTRLIPSLANTARGGSVGGTTTTTTTMLSPSPVSPQSSSRQGIFRFDGYNSRRRKKPSLPSSENRLESGSSLSNVKAKIPAASVAIQSVLDQISDNNNDNNSNNNYNVNTNSSIFRDLSISVDFSVNSTNVSTNSDNNNNDNNYTQTLLQESGIDVDPGGPSSLPSTRTGHDQDTVIVVFLNNESDSSSVVQNSTQNTQ